jgi:hypothetical protein
MKLKHIFENTPINPYKANQIHRQLKRKFITAERNRIIIDDIGQIIYDGDLVSINGIGEKNIPVKLDRVIGTLHLQDIDSLVNLPRTVNKLAISNSPITDFSTLSSLHIRQDQSSNSSLRIFNCPNLRSLDNIETIQTSNGEPLQVLIGECLKVKWDPYELVTKHNMKIEIYRWPPPSTPLVNAIALTSESQIKFTGWFPGPLLGIINKYRGQRAAMISLRRELIANGYEQHAEIT